MWRGGRVDFLHANTSVLCRMTHRGKNILLANSIVGDLQLLHLTAAAVSLTEGQRALFPVLFGTAGFPCGQGCMWAAYGCPPLCQ
jgi:hypothetical protein